MSYIISTPINATLKKVKILHLHKTKVLVHQRAKAVIPICCGASLMTKGHALTFYVTIGP